MAIHTSEFKTSRSLIASGLLTNSKRGRSFRGLRRITRRTSSKSSGSSKERWPAYGYETSEMNVAMPRVYMNAGWGGAGRDQDKMNWNAFYCCLEGFSPAASVLREGELLIPWVHVWLGGRYLDFVMRGRKLPECWVMSEMACHMMLRGGRDVRYLDGYAG